jgi:MFS family permease
VRVDHPRCRSGVDLRPNHGRLRVISWPDKRAKWRSGNVSQRLRESGLRDENVSATSSAGNARGWRELFSDGNTSRSIVLASAVALHGFFMFVTSTLLPSIVTEIGGMPYYAWVTTIFGVGSITGSMLAPGVLRWIPARRAYQFALLLFLFGSIFCATASDMAAIILGRAVQGLAGGMLATVATSMIPTLFSPHLRARAIALVSSVWGPLSLVGPFVAGTLAEFGSWRSAFWVALPLVLLTGVLADRVLPSSRPDQDHSKLIFSLQQIFRLLLVAGAVLILSIASVPGNTWIAVVGAGLALVCFVAAVRLDRQAAQRVLLVGAFERNSPVGASSTTMMLLVLGVGAGSFVPYVLTFAQGASTVTAGYVGALSSLAWAIAALLSAGSPAGSNRRVLLLAPCTAAIAMLAVAWSIWMGSLMSVAASWALFGMSVGMAWPHLASRLISYSPLNERAAAGGFVTSLQILGGTFGAALAGMTANLAGLGKSAVPADVAHGGSILFICFALPPFIAILTSGHLLGLTAGMRGEAKEPSVAS